MRKRQIADVGNCRQTKPAYLSLNSISISELKSDVLQSRHLRFAVLIALTAIALLISPFLCRLLAVPEAEPPRYLSPSELAISADGLRIYVVCEQSDELRVVDAKTGSVVRSIAVGHVPRGLALSPDGSHVYVVNSWSDTVSEIDTASLSIVRTLPTGWEPTGVATDQSGSALFVANRLSDDVSVIDLRNGHESKRLEAGHGASYLTRSTDGARTYCTHVYPNSRLWRKPPESEITVIDNASQNVSMRLPLLNSAGVFHVALSSNGRWGVAAQLRPKNLIPMAHVEHGWVFGDSLALFGADVGGTVTVPLDELDRYFAMPFGVAISPDQSTIYAGASGSDSVTVISVVRLLKFVSTHRATMATDLSASANYVVSRIAVGKNPRGMVLSPDGKLLYVANRMDDTLCVIDTARNSVVATISLGGPREITNLRKGETLFHSARNAFQGQFSCANCHIDATFDGLQWDLEPDGFGKDIVDNRSIESLSGTEPFKWNGSNPDLLTECGSRTEMYIYRSQSYGARELMQLSAYVLSIPLRPNRYRLPEGQLTPAQARGRSLFERARLKSGRPLPRHNQCSFCHSGPKGTNQKLSYVGTTKLTDRSEMLDVPQLTDVAYSAPYLHDGSARTLEELWTIFNPNDAHGVTSDLSADEMHDLVEYLKTL
jgi:YVTN family beta-propeller protein